MICLFWLQGYVSLAFSFFFDLWWPSARFFCCIVFFPVTQDFLCSFSFIMIWFFWLQGYVSLDFCLFFDDIVPVFFCCIAFFPVTQDFLCSFSIFVICIFWLRGYVALAFSFLYNSLLVFLLHCFFSVTQNFLFSVFIIMIYLFWLLSALMFLWIFSIFFDHSVLFFPAAVFFLLNQSHIQLSTENRYWKQGKHSRQHSKHHGKRCNRATDTRAAIMTSAAFCSPLRKHLQLEILNVSLRISRQGKISQLRRIF